MAAMATMSFSSYATSPEAEREKFVKYFTDKFPNTPVDDFINGVYSIDAGAREQWEEIEEFPPYELSLTNGEELFNTPFANGKTYADCFPNGGIGVRQNYPYWDAERGMVKTLELEINECREANGEKALKYKRGAMADLSSYMTYTSRGGKINVEIPDDPRALKAYEEGRDFWYTKRGQLNMACADCHLNYSGSLLRTDVLSPALGHTSGFPVYRSKWGSMGTLHRRFGGCNEQVRAKSFAAQGPEYRNLEYFMSYMNNGLVINGPSARK
jgi:sulfur-oxidizing protein SoxA